MKEMFLQNGFSANTPPHQILEMLLFYSIPRKDTNEIAHKLIDRFGSLSKVFEAPLSELVKVEGITENSACLLKMILPVARRYSEDKNYYNGKPLNHEKCIEILSKYFFGITDETVYILFLDHKGVMISCDKMSEGDNSSVTLSMKKIIESVIKHGAAAVMLSHNHPMGYAFPSDSDCVLTKKVYDTLKSIDVTLLDHVIFAGDDCISMAVSEKFRHLFK